MFKQDTWLSDILGCRTFCVENKGTFDKESFEEFCRTIEGKIFFYVKLPLNAKDQLKRFLENGFYLIDIGLTFHRPVQTDTQIFIHNRDILVRALRREDGIAIQAIASTVFQYDRFHCDPLIDKDTADKLKKSWVASYIDGRRGDFILVAEQMGNVVGFLAALSKTVGDRPILVLDLIGVNVAYQHKGIGGVLVRSLIDNATAQGKDILVNTQITNIPSINLYEKCGFCLKESVLVLHAHINNPFNPIV